MGLDEHFLKILVCPQTKLTLSLAPQDLVARLNQSIAEGKLKNRKGATIKEKIDHLLLRSDGILAYPIRDDIPVLLVEEGIGLENSSLPQPR